MAIRSVALTKQQMLAVLGGSRVLWLPVKLKHSPCSCVDQAVAHNSKNAAFPFGPAPYLRVPWCPVANVMGGRFRPPFHEGDFVWVKERHALPMQDEKRRERTRDGRLNVVYEAGATGSSDHLVGLDREGSPRRIVRWCGPSSMPRWASRVTLRIEKATCVKRGGVWMWRFQHAAEPGRSRR